MGDRVKFADLRKAALERLWPPFWDQPWMCQKHRDAAVCADVREWWADALTIVLGRAMQPEEVLRG